MRAPRLRHAGRTTHDLGAQTGPSATKKEHEALVNIARTTLASIMGMGLLAGAAWTAEGVPLSVICVEAETGLVIHEENADIVRPPASMVKLMQLLLLDDGIAAGSFTLDAPIAVSENAKSMGGTQVFLKAGETRPLREMIPAVTVASANDAAEAICESLWGGLPAYLQAMNERAAVLGMAHSVFHSAHGLPPARGQESDMTTARDMAQLARDCCRRPRILEWTSLRELVFRPKEAARRSTNRLLGRLPGCDGLKTGYTRAAGFCIAATAKRNDIRLICVVMGAPSNRARFDLAAQRLEKSFAAVQRVRMVQGGAYVTPPVMVVNGEERAVRMAAQDDLWVTVKTEDVPRLETVTDCPERVQAPLAGQKPVGEVRVQLGSVILARTPLVTPYELVAATKSASRRWW